jgi:hypothetical protein
MDHTRLVPSSKWARALVPLVATLSAFAMVPGVARVNPATELGQVTETVAEPLAGMAGAAAGAVVRTVSNDGRHLGFDTNVYPGENALRAWKESAPYEWVGFYLPAPCHKDDSWAGKRETLTELGYGTAVIYVGQQTWGRTTSPSAALTGRALKKGKTCDAALMGAARGKAEAADAVRKTAAEGFAEGTVIFLDVERMERVPVAMRDYYRAWVAAVLADGRFRPGVYVHKYNAELVYDDVKREFGRAGSAEEPTFWVASGRGFSHDAAPTDVGHQFAGVWQGMLDIVEKHGGVKLPIDVNVAAVPSPSGQFAAATSSALAD